MRSTPFGCVLLIALAAGCGGSEPTAESAADAASEPAPAMSAEAQSKADPEAGSSDEEATAKPEPKPKADLPEPDFKPNGSVAEAINAVPPDAPRLNIEQDALGRPLNDPELYATCKAGNAHFKAKVAVWDGKAVGVDITTTPKSQKLADCIADKIRSVTWPDKVKSVNVVEYSF